MSALGTTGRISPAAAPRPGATTALARQRDPGTVPRRATLVLAFAPSKESAATLAFAALFQPFAEVSDQQVGAWRNWQSNCQVRARLPPALTEQLALRHGTASAPRQDLSGAMVASLNIPWGKSRDDIGGYHLVWSRDLTETAGALLALGAEEEARNVLRYLIATQQEDGHWVQNQWFGGEPFWQRVQLDETRTEKRLILLVFSTECERTSELQQN
jgi:glucoamylase